MEALKTDLYQLTMAAGYFHRSMSGSRVTCEMFVRRLPKRRRYLVAMGIERAVGWLENLRFGEDDIAYLASVPALADAMTPAFRDYLRAFRFTGDVAAVAEGTVVFETEPLVRITAPIIEAQIVETMLLSAVNHATVIASKAARVVSAAKGAAVLEMGTRRTHPEAAIDAARAAYAVGFAGTSNVEAGRRFGIPVVGTAAHMWTMAHASEEDAFNAYCSVYPRSSILLIDTYDTIRGAECAARVAREKLRGVRLDSGDLESLSRRVRAVLDAAGCKETKIVASGDLNEDKIAALVARGAPIDMYGVGTDLVTSPDAPALGGVYKLVAIEEGGVARPIAKFSEGKGTLPGAHQVYRTRDVEGRIDRDLVTLANEADEKPEGEALLVDWLRGGARVRPADTLDAIRARAKRELDSLSPWFHDLGHPEVGASPVEVSSAVKALTEVVRARYLDAAKGGSR